MINPPLPAKVWLQIWAILTFAVAGGMVFGVLLAYEVLGFYQRWGCPT